MQQLPLTLVAGTCLFDSRSSSIRCTGAAASLRLRNRSELGLPLSSSYTNKPLGMVKSTGPANIEVKHQIMLVSEIRLQGPYLDDRLASKRGSRNKKSQLSDIFRPRKNQLAFTYRKR